MRSTGRTGGKRLAAMALSCLLWAGLGALPGGCADTMAPADGPNQAEAEPTEDPNQPDSFPDGLWQEEDTAELLSPTAELSEASERPAIEPPVSAADSAAIRESPSDRLGSTDSTTPDGSANQTDNPVQNEGAPSCINRLALVAAPDAHLSAGSTLTVGISLPVRAVSQEELISFVQTHQQLFTEQQWQELVGHQHYRRSGHGADLLLGVLGLVLREDMEYYRNHPTASMAPQDQAQQDLLAALSQLESHAYAMQGRRTAVAASVIRASPRYYAKVTRLAFADGSSLRAVNTHLVVTDETGGYGMVGKANEAPLGLFSAGGFPEALQVTHGYTSVAEAAEELFQGQQVTLEIAQPIQCVSHDTLVTFVHEHANLFSAAEYQAVTVSEPFADASRTPDLLLGILGVKLGGSFEYFVGASKLEMTAYDTDDQEFLTALSALENRSYTLSGSHTVVGAGEFGAIPHVFALTTRVVLPGGGSFEVIGTRVAAGDDAGRVDEVRSHSDSLRLQLNPG
ncbi:hypothetical protein ACFL5O_06705 [Myxococcota bacterium]